jgi:hypothetical protein
MKRLMVVLAFPLLAASAASASEAIDASEAYVEAQRDFDAVRSELGLSGSAPLAGLERAGETPWEQAARLDFEVMQGSLGLSGSAPLVGLETYALTVRPQVAYVILASAPARGR